MKKIFSYIKRKAYIHRKPIRVFKAVLGTFLFYEVQTYTQVDLSPLYIVIGFYFVNQIKK